MTATVKPPEGASRRHTLRFSSLESLGFSDAAHTWSDTPVVRDTPSRGRHETTLADLEPVEFGHDLDRSNVRWGLITLVALVIGSLGVFGYWLYQRPAVVEQAAVTEVVSAAHDLEAAIPTLLAANTELSDDGTLPDGPALAAAESEARALFELSGTVNDFETRVAASDAAGAALDALRLIRETSSYQAALVPSLAAPPLETDPEAIELDQAARSFGEWQLSFTSMRSALPDNVLPRVTQELEVIAADLNRILSDYVDALREDDQEAATLTLSNLDTRLTAVGETMSQSIVDIQNRVELQIATATAALERILTDD